MMADAIQTAGDIGRNNEVDVLRIDATRALLGIYHRVYFGRSLMIALDSEDDLAASVRDKIGQTVDRAIATAQTSKMPFDLATQAAFFLGILAALDDDHAARASESLLSIEVVTNRTTREVAYALGWGTGPATHIILERLALSPSASISEDAQDSLFKRTAATQEQEEDHAL